MVLDNPLIHKTTAWQKGQIVYLSPDSYLAFGGYYQWHKDAQIILDAFNKTAQTSSDTVTSEPKADTADSAPKNK